ncbi:hypothetical protein MalM25_16450 [Planctomycetes bacterium MalM25]|nr:hypothetical protein MalM25_16450 [Planctomycetes bacterium MalM25]
MTTLSQRVITGGLLLALIVGCRGPLSSDEGGGKPFVSIGNPLEWGAESSEPRSGTPQRIVATWSDTIRQKMGESAERGFGGRLYFYDSEVDPITVDGRLVIYAFDESNRNPTDHKPTRRYIFPTDQLTKHMSESEIGPSYSVWLPWGGVEGAPTHVSLIARFEPSEGGGLVVSEQARQRLPGRGIATPDSGVEVIANQPSTEGVRQTGFEAPVTVKSVAGTASEEKADRKKLSTTTIRLSR